MSIWYRTVKNKNSNANIDDTLTGLNIKHFTIRNDTRGARRCDKFERSTIWAIFFARLTNEIPATIILHYICALTPNASINSATIQTTRLVRSRILKIVNHSYWFTYFHRDNQCFHCMSEYQVSNRVQRKYLDWTHNRTAPSVLSSVPDQRAQMHCYLWMVDVCDQDKWT